MRIRRDDVRIINENSHVVRIFDVAEFSRHDGPGTRVVVYFQGCNVHCDWCHSPHSQLYTSPLLYNENLCSGCRRCENSCLNHVHSFENGIHEIDRTRCTQCGICIDNCPASTIDVKGSALHLPTIHVGVESLFQQIKPYMELTRTNGGITLSGGEALLQLDSVIELLNYCKSNHYSTAVETSGLLSFDTYKKVLPLVDLWLFGFRMVTGQNNKRYDRHISQVLNILRAGKAEILPRIPMIPGYFDREDVLNGIKDLLLHNDIHKICLSPWNMDYKHYYTQSGLPLLMDPPSADAIEQCRHALIRFVNQQKFQIYEN